MIELLKAKGFELSKNTQLTSLTGGVSCDIFLVQDGENCFVVKQALAKLKVKQDWFADTNRNMYEQRYLQYLNTILPQCAPKVIAAFEHDNLFVMEYLGNQHQDWKKRLLQKEFCSQTAHLIGYALGVIHQKSWLDPIAKDQFDSDDNFKELRLAPYFETLADSYPEQRPAISALCQKIAGRKLCLVHGDFSPKNILVKKGDVKIIDCEVAWFGDPAFDVAFMLHHLFLKYFHFNDPALLKLSRTFINAYQSALTPVYLTDVPFDHIANITALLMLARIDGKSPVEYLSQQEKKQVRKFALTLFAQKITTYHELEKEIQQHEN
ncbi:phosphotransferase family protein [Thalassotalea sp. PLHSN55]|uniref:phosphotransferase family protein n=1 Tax=Thalassotalea sp. PLHSN55 TaxID=3435888 RepID=UPI003F82DCD9